MALRFRKSFKLAPGVRMNLSGSGASWTLGPRGASVGIGKRGAYLNTGIPGTGLSSRTSLEGSGRRSVPATLPNGSTKMALSVEVSDEGEISFKDEQGNPVPESVISLAKKQKGDAIRALIQKKCDEINSEVEALGRIHQYTPNHSNRPTFVPVPYDVVAPSKPALKQPFFFAQWFKSWVARIEAENARQLDTHRSAMFAWSVEKEKFDLAQAKRKHLIDRVVAGDIASMESFLEETLHEIMWPRETELSFEFLDGSIRIAIDVDLPEIEDMPDKSASVPQRGLRLSVKNLSSTQVQKLYMQHVHAVGFRIIGETFAALPTVQEVILSAYSQRPNRATGHIRDDYLFSVRVARADWSRINFDSLEQLDVVEALSQFELRRQMSKTGVFKAVKPIVP